MLKALSVDRVAFWRHNGVVYYVHRSRPAGREPVLVINAIGQGRTQRYAVLTREETSDSRGWELADGPRRSHLMETLLERMQGERVSLASTGSPVP